MSRLAGKSEKRFTWGGAEAAEENKSRSGAALRRRLYHLEGFDGG